MAYKEATAEAAQRPPSGKRGPARPASDSGAAPAAAAANAAGRHAAAGGQARYARAIGDVFRSNDAIVGEMFHIAERELIEQIFQVEAAQQYNVGEPRQVMSPVTGPSSILLLDGERHMRMRKLMLPPFHGEAIAHYAELIEQITNREIDSWRPGDTIRTRTVAQPITMEVIIRAVFGITDPERIAELKRVLPRLSSPNPLLLLVQKDLGPRSPWGRFLRRATTSTAPLRGDRAAPRRSRPRRATTSSPCCCPPATRTGEPLTDRELRDELITLLLAGHETTATSIGWSVRATAAHARARSSG